MIDDILLSYIFIFVLLEMYEVQWQKATTLIGMLARMFEYYKKSIFLFLVKHPTFYFAIWFMVVNDYNIYAVSLFAIKTLDIATKIVLMKRVFIDKDISPELSLAMLTPLNKFLPYIGVVAYPPLIFLAMS
ncbi:MAG: hypothetical protein L3I99_00550 [Sulfurimonas sp.]|nr:hypothetical protein [Sulfurimonas sp.]